MGKWKLTFPRVGQGGYITAVQLVRGKVVVDISPSNSHRRGKTLTTGNVIKINNNLTC